MLYFLKFCGYAAVMLAIIPIAGFCVSGSLRGAWRYSKAWGQVMLIIFAVAGVFWLILQPFMPHP
jgi:hypothetical protein